MRSEDIGSDHVDGTRAGRPNQEDITRTILELWPDTDQVTTQGGSFFSLDPENHWPNVATIVSTDDFDQVSKLSRPDVFRLNIGVGRARFLQLVGSMDQPDYSALDRLLPYPVYARQGWISILNPSGATFQNEILPLLTEAHDRLAAKRGRSSGD